MSAAASPSICESLTGEPAPATASRPRPRASCRTSKSGATMVRTICMAPLGVEPRIWLIGGPTASGKSALALKLAQAIGGEILNADSMQLYADLDILTARPSREET